MNVRLKLKPGQKGTKGLLAIYGESLICVRYRYDEASRTRVKTVEIIVDKKAWIPPRPKFADDEIVPVRIASTESGLKKMAKIAGGKWNRAKKLWFIPYGKIKGTAMEKHVILDATL